MSGNEEGRMEKREAKRRARGDDHAGRPEPAGLTGCC